MKMYILIKESIQAEFALVAAAHGSLACYLKFKEHPEMDEWLRESFRKVICKVSEQEFEQAKEVERHVVITESALGGREVAIVFCPRKEYPKHFKFLKLYKMSAAY